MWILATNHRLKWSCRRQAMHARHVSRARAMKLGHSVRWSTHVRRAEIEPTTNTRTISNKARHSAPTAASRTDQVSSYWDRPFYPYRGSGRVPSAAGSPWPLDVDVTPQPQSGVGIQVFGRAHADHTLDALEQLHAAESVHAVSECITALLGQLMPTAPPSSTVDIEAAAAAITPTAGTTSVGVEGQPMLLSGSVYELIFYKLSVYPIPRLANAVYSHMMQMGMQPSRPINQCLLQILAGARMWRECVRRCRSMVTDLRSQDDSAEDAREYINIALGACAGSAQVNAALDLFRLFDPVQADQVALEPDAESYDKLLFVLGQSHTVSMVDETMRHFNQLRTRGITPTEPMWTSAIVANANAGRIERALALMSEQKKATESQEESVSLRAYLATIIACMEQEETHGKTALALWCKMHASHASADAADLSRLPFAYHPPESVLSPSSSSSSSSSPADPQLEAQLLMPTLRFHFCQLGVRQFRSAMAHIERACQAGELAPTDFLPVLDELSGTGRCMLLHYIVLVLDEDMHVRMHHRLAQTMLHACALAKPHTEWRQAEQLLLWMRHHGIPRKSMAYVSLIQAYTLAHPVPLWRQAMMLQEELTDASVDTYWLVKWWLIEACSRACSIEKTEPGAPTPLMHRGYDKLAGTRTLMPKGKVVAPLPAAESRVVNPVPSESAEAFSTARDIFFHIDPALLTPAMHLQFMCAALQAGEYSTALGIFCKQYNADVDRLAALTRENQLDRECATLGMSDPSSHEHAPSPSKRFFRSALDIGAINGIIFACSEMKSPLNAFEVWQLLKSGHRSDLQPAAFSAPVGYEDDTGDVSNQLSSPSSSPSRRTLWSLPPLANHSTEWQMVSWIDALDGLRRERVHRLNKKAKNRSGGVPMPTVIIGNATTGMATPSTDSMASPSATEGVGVHRTSDTASRRIVLPTFKFSRTSLETMPLADLTSLITSFRQIEHDALASLARPNAHRQSVWQAFTAPLNCTMHQTFTRGTSHTASPFHVNLHGLGQDHVRSNVESVLYLSLRRIQAIYLETGEVDLSGWNIVHGYGRPAPAVSTVDASSRAYSPASRSEWVATRYRPASRDPQMPSNPLGRVLHHFLDQVGLTPQLLHGEGNRGMTRISVFELRRWLGDNRLPRDWRTFKKKTLPLLRAQAHWEQER